MTLCRETRVRNLVTRRRSVSLKTWLRVGRTASGYEFQSRFHGESGSRPM